MVVILLGLPVLVSCSGDDSENVKADYPTDDPYPRGTLQSNGRTDSFESSSLFGGEDIALFGETDAGLGSGGGLIGVNSYLWRGALDTLSFLPLTQADPFGGVIISDWFTPPETPNERFKVTAFILDRTLRSDGIRVSAFRQVQQTPGSWIDAEVNERLSSDLEDTILTRARQLRINNFASQ